MLIEDGISADRTTTVHDGVNLKRIAATPRRDTHAALGLPPGVPLVGNIAALVPHKGHRFLIEAAGHVIHQLPDVRFVIIGKGQLEQALQDRDSVDGQSRWWLQTAASPIAEELRRQVWQIHPRGSVPV